METVAVVALVLVAAYSLAGPKVLEQLKAAAGKLTLPKIEGRHMAAAAAIAAAAILYAGSRTRDGEPTPAPPDPVAGLDLRGTFVGPDASQDAAITAALLDEVAAELEWDAMQPDPLYKSGLHVEELRTRARELRCRGVSLGEKHPRARAAIKGYLDATAGTSGGPLTPDQTAAWIAAYREVARAARNASR